MKKSKFFFSIIVLISFFIIATSLNIRAELQSSSFGIAGNSAQNSSGFNSSSDSSDLTSSKSSGKIDKNSSSSSSQNKAFIKSGSINSQSPSSDISSYSKNKRSKSVSSDSSSAQNFYNSKTNYKSPPNNEPQNPNSDESKIHIDNRSRDYNFNSSSSQNSYIFGGQSNSDASSWPMGSINSSNDTSNSSFYSFSSEEPSTTSTPPAVEIQPKEIVPQKSIVTKNIVGVTEPKPFSFELNPKDQETLTGTELLSAQIQNDQDNNEARESHSVPSDLPQVESSEIILPQVPAINTDKSSRNLISGIIAWSFIILGVTIIVFVLFKGGRQKKDISLNTNSSTKKRKRKSKLLSDKYYKG